MTVWLGPLISGLFALVVAYASYRFAVRKSKIDLVARLQEVDATARQARLTAQEQYRLDAEKAFLAAVRPASGQVVETIHDLTDRMCNFTSSYHIARSWLASDGYYRRTFAWFLACPFAWLEILRRKRTQLDQTLGPVVEEHYRFLQFCHLFERSFSSTGLFEGFDYDASSSTAHFFSGTLRTAAEDLIVVSGDQERCMTFSDFGDNMERFRPRWLGEVEEFLSGLSETATVAGQLRLARVVAIYSACCQFDQRYPISYRPQLSVDQAFACADLIPDAHIRDTISRNLSDWLAEKVADPA